MSDGWAKWEKQVINGVFPLRRSVSFSDHSAVFLTEHKARNLPNALLKLVPAIPTLKDAQLAHWSAAATLAHPHLVPILESGRCQLGGLQFLFVVMEYAEVTLAKLLTQRALAPDALRKGMRPILTSLAFLHRRQLVHGSLEPSNILLVNQQLKLASDTVRPTGASAASIAPASVYDPPESRDGSFSAAGDIWSLGVIMVEALTQRRPSCLDRRSGAVSLPTAIPPQFAQLIRQCLSSDPANRPTVVELYARINPAQPATVTPVRYPVLLPPELAPAAEPATEAPAPERFAREEPSSTTPAQQLPKRRSFVPVGATILVVLIALSTALRLVNSQTYPRPAAATAVASKDLTARKPTTVILTPTAVPALSPAPEFAKSKALLATDPILHEEAPGVALTALATIHGNIRIAVKVAVDHSGNVARTTLATHSPSRYFTRLATETARKWKFSAADEQGTRKWLLWFEFTRNGASAHAANRQPWPGRAAPPAEGS
jgi:outer membrane biosynthesis protein TonB